MLIVASPEVLAQLTLQPLKAKQNTISSGKPRINARTKEETPVSLPFFDDFSTFQGRPDSIGRFPDTTRWKGSRSISVNDGMAIRQPSVGVATFDGLDESGIAYNVTDNLVTGFRDTLMSAPIDLASVPVSERSSVYLSFYYQWQGNGEAPDGGDFLELEFRDNANTWQTIQTFNVTPELQRDQFYLVILPIREERYFHTGFQFRFRNFGRQSGPYDTWNVDYFYLNSGRTSTDNSFPERSAASLPSSLLGQYRAIPYRHVKGSVPFSPVTFDVQNLKNSETPVSINYRATADFIQYQQTGTTRSGAVLVASQGVKGTTGVMLPLERATVTLNNLPDPANALHFPESADSVDIRLKFKVISADSVEDDRTRYAPINFQINDTISAAYRLADYYAYDDGTAEFTAGLIEAGNQIAIQYDMLSTQPDTLIAFAINFPPYGITSNQTIDFVIYDDDNGKPGEVLQRISSRTIQRKKVDEFQLIRFSPALLIENQRFYIGWQQPIAGKALVGLDVTNNSGDKIFVNTNGFWFQNTAVRGSVMLRPVFGKGEIDIVSGIEERNSFSVYPNPTRGQFVVNEVFDDVKIFSTAGLAVNFNSSTDGEKTIIELKDPTPGLYVVRGVRGTTMSTSKVMVVR